MRIHKEAGGCMSSNQTFNQYVVKKENKALVLEIIKNRFPLSRAEIAQNTGLNKSTVSSLVNELLLEQLIYEAGAGESSGGRKPVMLFFNELAGFTIGIDLGVNYILGVLTDLNGHIITEEKVEYTEPAYQQVREELFQMINKLMASSPSSIYGIVGIGVGVPGAVNKEGKILSAPNLGWENIDLKAALEETYDLPVLMENEAKAGAYGEKRFGAGQEFRNMVYISIGIGIGSGLILDDVLYQGSNGFAGEMGHMTIEVDGKTCSCGNIGCWELYASEQALKARAKKLKIPLTGKKENVLEQLIIRASSGDLEALNVFIEVGDFIGIGINNIINTFNPEQIIIGNRMTAAKKWLKPAIEARLNHTNLAFRQKDLTIDFSELNAHSAAIGMSAFIIENFLILDLSQT